MNESRKISALSGFTLVELLVVVSIVGLLAVLVTIAFTDTRTKSFDARRASDVSDISKAIELYYTDFRTYPPGANLNLGESSARCLSESGFSATCPGGERIYLGVIPANPGPGGTPYVYTQGVDTFTLTFTLESDTGSIPAGFHTLTPEGVE